MTLPVAYPPDPPVAQCEGCDSPQKCRYYLARFSGKPLPQIVRYCGECAMLARANWNGETVSLIGPFSSLGVAEGELGRLERIRTHVAAAMGAAIDGDYPGLRRNLFSALTLVECRSEMQQLIEEVAAQSQVHPVFRGALGVVQ